MLATASPLEQVLAAEIGRRQRDVQTRAWTAALDIEWLSQHPGPVDDAAVRGESSTHGFWAAPAVDRPEAERAMQAMLTMKKLDIAELRAAADGVPAG